MIEYLRNWFWTYIWKPLPDMPFGDWMETFIRWARDAWAAGFDAVDTGLEFLYTNLADGLLWLPSGVMVLLFAAIAWAAKGWKLGAGIGLGMFVVAWTPYWEETMQTLSMVLVSAAIAILLAIPLGIAAAENKAVSAVARPVLIATIIFAMPPGVRLTELGLRQVDREVVEAGQAFGASPARILARIKLPLALPTIMAGLNQVIMLALSMVVIAGLVGGGGLGSVISGSLGRLDIAAGFNAGLAVVLLAILLDRVTQGLSDRTPVARAAKLAR